jgi:hypothetical protein
MRVMARISVPVEEGNKAVSEGKMGKIMGEAAARWKPEAMHFTTFDGKRTCFMVFDLPESADMPTFSEPFFTGLNADVQLAPAMNAEDLQRGLSSLG